MSKNDKNNQNMDLLTRIEKNNISSILSGYEV